MRGRRGLTLVETLATLVVVGLLLAIVGPTLNGVTAGWRLRAAANRVENVVLFARHAAAAENAPFQALYDVPDGPCWARRGQDTFARVDLPAGVRIESVRFPDGTVVRRDVAAVRAWPNGTVDPHEVALVNAEGRRIRLTYNRLTGEPSFEEAQDASSP